MALTITVGSDVNKKASAPTKLYPLTFVGEAAYVQGTGTASFESVVQTAVGENVTLVNVLPNMSTTPKYIPVYDSTNDALKLLDMSTAAEAANGDYSTVTFKILAVCI